MGQEEWPQETPCCWGRAGPGENGGGGARGRPGKGMLDHPDGAEGSARDREGVGSGGEPTSESADLCLSFLVVFFLFFFFTFSLPGWFSSVH